MADPVTFQIAWQGGLWVLTRDGRRQAEYSHLDRATHEAVELARELFRTGQPTRVLVEAAEGKLIEVDTEPRTRDGPLPADDGVDRSRA